MAASAVANTASVVAFILFSFVCCLSPFSSPADDSTVGEHITAEICGADPDVQSAQGLPPVLDEGGFGFWHGFSVVGFMAWSLRDKSSDRTEPARPSGGDLEIQNCLL